MLTLVLANTPRTRGNQCLKSHTYTHQEPIDFFLSWLRVEVKEEGVTVPTPHMGQGTVRGS